MAGRKGLIAVVTVLMCCSISTVEASSAQDYLTVGRSQMFAGTQSGLRQAYQTFDDALKDGSCADCAASRDLHFLHAATRTAMLGLRDDSGSIDSIMELGKAFGLTVVGDSLDPNKLTVHKNLDEHDLYKIPDGAPDANGIRNLIDTTMLPEINAILAELDLISDSPGNRFKMYFEPNETGLMTQLEVDYGEVLALRGILKAVKAQMQAKQAYDTIIGPDEKFFEKIYGKCLSYQDLLNRYPNLLKVGPTSSYGENGQAALLQARRDWIEDCNSALAVIDYISAEDTPAGSDPQSDELLYFDPNDRYVVDEIREKLITLRSSLQNDTIGVYTMQTTKMYIISGADATWRLELTSDFSGQIEEGKLILISSSMPVPAIWDVDWLDKEGANLVVGFTSNENWCWTSGMLTGTISDDGNNISDGMFDYWGCSYGNITGLAGSVTSITRQQKQFDPNPILGSTLRYPAPVNLQDLLPSFDKWNSALPGTAGHGLGNDAKLGGILPDMTQRDWQVIYDLQPAGTVYLTEVYLWQMDPSRHYVGVWLQNQKMFADISGDTENNSSQVQWTDVRNLYMGYDENNLYGAITCYDNNLTSNAQTAYDIYLSYANNYTEALGTIKFHLETSSGGSYGWIEQMRSDFGYPSWQYMSSFEVEAGQEAVNFVIPFELIPDYMFGRFISVKSNGWSNDWTQSDGEENLTHVQIGELGSISGIVNYDDFTGAPIFVQAFTDHQDPEGSIVASTMIAEPGPYTLDGIGLGWNGYVRAFTPLFGFNMFDTESFAVQAAVEVYEIDPDLDYVDLTLFDPEVLEPNEWVSGILGVADNVEGTWYVFEAMAGGLYHLELELDGFDEGVMTLYSRNGYDEIQGTCCMPHQGIDWQCPVSGRYFVRVCDSMSTPPTYGYRIRMWRCPSGDIGGPAGLGASDCSNDYYDLRLFISQWLAACGEPDWCGGADINRDNSVNMNDFVLLASDWLESM